MNIKFFLIPLILMPIISSAQNASQLSNDQKCDVIAEYSVQSYQRYLDGNTKDSEYKLIEQFTIDDPESQKKLKALADISYDMPKYTAKEDIDFLKAGMKKKSKELCLKEPR